MAGEFPVGANSLFHAADGAGLARVTVRGLAPGCTSIREVLNVKYHGVRAVVNSLASLRRSRGETVASGGLAFGSANPEIKPSTYGLRGLSWPGLA